jgi:predicted ATPase
MDNFEQVVVAAPLVVAWLQAAPQLAVLATSRAPLQVSGEHTYLVPPMALPESTAAAPATWAGSEAVQLFVLRAQATQADFRLDDASGPVVAAICRRLDGLPLAIELAAARLGVFPAQALLARLGSPAAVADDGGAGFAGNKRCARSSIGVTTSSMPNSKRSFDAWRSLAVAVRSTPRRGSATLTTARLT